MNPIPYQLQPQPPSSHWLPLIPPDPPRSNCFWGTSNIYNQLRELQATVNLAKTMQKELEMLMVLKDKKYSVETVDNTSSENYVSGFLKHLEARKIDLESQETLSVEAANSLMRKLRAQLEPFRFVADEATPWEEKSAAVRFVTKAQKSKRNKLWRKRKKKRIAETLSKAVERFEQADREADEWRAREVAKESTKKKVDKMNEIAKLKAKEEKKKLESELELVLIVEKLQELRSIRIQKLKKQGHFLPEEDDKFLERVRAAVEEEERQALAAAETDAARDSITTAEESRKAIQNSEALLKDGICDDNVIKEKEEQGIESKDKGVTSDNINNRSERHGHTSVYDYVANLPVEFYHYYHGSNTDIGTLIEVRRTWDAYIRPGGSRIPGHWVLPPPPSDKVWASYLVRPH